MPAGAAAATDVTPLDVEASPADAVTVERALGVPTRAGIYRRLRTATTPATAREVAETFGLHPNVARNHLDTLAKAGLLVTGRRKHPGGGRPAKVYVAREQSQGPSVAVPAGGQLAVAAIVSALGGFDGAAAAVEQAGLAQGRKLVTAAAGKADHRDFEAAAVVAVEALRASFPEARLVSDGEDAVHVDGLEVGLRVVGDVDGPLGDALARGLVRGALEAAGAPVRTHAANGRVRATLDLDGEAAARTPQAQVDARGQTYQAGVVMTMRAMVALQAGDELEVLSDTQGAPAAFARWADRAGHLVVDVARVRDLKGEEAVRLLLRKATSVSGVTAAR